METPAAEVDIDEALVDELVRQQHPGFAAPLRLVTNGWDNVIFRLGEHNAVRLPRRAVAVQLIENEQRWLPGIAARMPLAVPAPLAAGIPSALFPWPWSILPWFDGIPADALDVSARDALAPALAAAVAALHVPAPADAPVNKFRGVPLRERDAVVRERLAALPIPALACAWEEGLAAPAYPGIPVWLHGDLHPGNAVVAADGALDALIDFGDLCAGDPAVDLAAAWLFFSAIGRQRFIAALHYDDATWLRARAWAAALALALHSGDSRMGAVADHAIAQLEI